MNTLKWETNKYLSSWVDDSQQLRGMCGTTIELGIEDTFFSQLQRAQPVDDTRSYQAHDTTISQEKGDATASQATDVGTLMTKNLQSQENYIQRTKERNQSHVEDISSNNTNTISTQASQQASMEQGTETTGVVNHDLEM